MFRRVDFEGAKVHWIWDDPAIRAHVIQDMAERGHAHHFDDDALYHTPHVNTAYDAGGAIFVDIDKWVSFDMGNLGGVGCLDSHVRSLVGLLERGNSSRERGPDHARYIKLHSWLTVSVIPANYAKTLLVAAKEWLAGQDDV